MPGHLSTCACGSERTSAAAAAWFFGRVHKAAQSDQPLAALTGFRLTAHLERIVLGISRTGREVSTLIVEVVETEAPAVSNPTKSIPRSRRLIMDMVLAAIEEAGEDIGREVEGAGIDGREGPGDDPRAQVEPGGDIDEQAESRTEVNSRVVQAQTRRHRDLDTAEPQIA